MSCYMVSKEHVDAMVTAGLEYGMPHRNRGPVSWLVPEPVNEHAYSRGEPWGPEAVADAERRRRTLTDDTAGQVGAMLLAENRRSVDHRYDEDELDPSEAYIYERFPRDITHSFAPVEILSAIRCYEYQACEHPGWETSEAHAFCRALEAAAIRALPGYDSAPWEITAETEPAIFREARERAEAQRRERDLERAGVPPAGVDRDEAITTIRAALKKRSGKAWSVRGDRGTAWGWLTITAPPRRCGEYGRMSDDDIVELASLLDVPVHLARGGVSVSPEARDEYVCRAVTGTGREA